MEGPKRSFLPVFCTHDERLPAALLYINRYDFDTHFDRKQGHSIKDTFPQKRLTVISPEQ